MLTSYPVINNIAKGQLEFQGSRRLYKIQVQRASQSWAVMLDVMLIMSSLGATLVLQVSCYNKKCYTLMV